MNKTRSLLSWAAVFVAGFLAGVFFAAWKLDTVTPGRAPKMEAREQNAQTELQARVAGLEKMLAAKPNDLNATIQLGNDYFDLGNHQKAVEYYEKALHIDPRNPDVMTDMGISYRKLGKPDESIKAFKKALEIDPKHAMALFNMGIVLRDDLKDDEGALAAWESFLKVAEESPHAVMIRPWVKQLKEKIAASSTTKGSEHK
ncbi:MAG TPA: tetratricopeptide repeat protein [Desulfomonilaceae bacterium]|nr:tetratricopeptide repeat protein [Desulfomonilaceae bacterium]